MLLGMTANDNTSEFDLMLTAPLLGRVREILDAKEVELTSLIIYERERYLMPEGFVEGKDFVVVQPVPLT